MTERRHLVLVGQGVDASAQATDLSLLAGEVGAQVAYLQNGSPGLNDVLDELAVRAPGAEVRLVAAPTGGSRAPGRSWLRRLAGDWVRRHPEALRVEVADRPVTGQEAGLTSAAWEDVPNHGRHLMVCRGPRCTARDATLTAGAIAALLPEHGLGDDDVLVTQSGCLYPCNQAPVVLVYPDDTWYGHVDAAAAERIVVEHLVGGSPVSSHRLPRASE